MTREERKKYVDDNFTFLAMSDAFSLVDQVYDDFEQRIAELESPGTCEGCEYEGYRPNLLPCMSCTRQGTDRYEPKEIQ